MRALSLLLLVGCVPTFEESDTESEPVESEPTETDATDTEATEQSLVGTWRSEGEDISELFSTYFDIVQVDATFSGDGSYDVTTTDLEGATVDYIGTFTVDVSTDIPTVVVSQTSPTEVTSEGIWQVEGDTLSYEIIQTTPDIGYTAPTPEGGFGSSSGPGLAAGVNVQIFQRQ